MVKQIIFIVIVIFIIMVLVHAQQSLFLQTDILNIKLGVELNLYKQSYMELL